MSDFPSTLAAVPKKPNNQWKNIPKSVKSGTNAPAIKSQNLLKTEKPKCKNKSLDENTQKIEQYYDIDEEGNVYYESDEYDLNSD